MAATDAFSKLLTSQGIISPEQLASEGADALLVLPWNLIEEVREQMPGTELVTAIPEVRHWHGVR